MTKLTSFHLNNGSTIIGEVKTDSGFGDIVLGRSLQLVAQPAQGRMEVGFAPIGIPVNADPNNVKSIALNRTSVAYHYPLDDSIPDHAKLMEHFEGTFSPIARPDRPQIIKR